MLGVIVVRPWEYMAVFLMTCLKKFFKAAGKGGNFWHLDLDIFHYIAYF